ncbi:MAG: DMT family transporter [Pseudomonadota bacterium]
MNSTPTAVLYAATVLIWGSTWVMVKYQLGFVPVQVSLGYRFAIAALALAAYGRLRNRRLGIEREDLPAVAVQGILMFSVNYFFIYAGTAYLASGLVAVLFTVMVLFNAVNERFFYGTAIEPLGLLAGVLALSGIALMFWPEISELTLSDETFKGIVLILIGSYMASLGNMAAIRNTRRKLPVIAVNVWGMGIGASASVIFAAVTGAPFVIDWQFSYLSSLLFLAIPGTAIAFGLYLVILDRIGATRSSYIAVMLPVVALLISTVFEGYRWTQSALIGLLISLGGNALALTVKPANKRQSVRGS